MGIYDRELIKQSNKLRQAAINESRDGFPISIHVETIELDEARNEYNPKIINVPFSYLIVDTATDNNAYINCKVGSRNQYQPAIKLFKYSEIEILKLGSDKVALYWEAQAGKSIRLIFLLGATFKLQSQSIENIIKDGSSFNQQTAVSVTTSVTQIVASDNDRSVVTIMNNRANTIYLGDSDVSTSDGMPLFPNSSVQIRNTASVYGIVVAGTSEARILEEK